MDALFAQAMKDTAVLRKTSVPWNADEPHPQTYHAYDPTTSSWVPKSPDATQPQEPSGITNIALYTWNIDFMLPHAEARMSAALKYLNHLTTNPPPNTNTATVIFLQECTPGDLTTIAATPWVRERFHLLDVDATAWATTHYGTTMLLDARLPIAAAFRVHYAKTRMERDASFVDVLLDGGKKKVRLCNSHLESLALEPPFRPVQMALIAGYLREEGVHAALAAGDFNAIQPADRGLHTENGLGDAFLETGGVEDGEEGFTWGQQAATMLRAQFGLSRMDKVYTAGAVRVVRFGRFGEDVVVEGEREAEEIVALGFEKAWVTDHLGVVAEVEVV